MEYPPFSSLIFPLTPPLGAGFSQLDPPNLSIYIIHTYIRTYIHTDRHTYIHIHLIYITLHCITSPPHTHVYIYTIFSLSNNPHYPITFLQQPQVFPLFHGPQFVQQVLLGFRFRSKSCWTRWITTTTAPWTVRERSDELGDDGYRRMFWLRGKRDKPCNRWFFLGVKPLKLVNSMFCKTFQTLGFAAVEPGWLI